MPIELDAFGDPVFGDPEPQESASPEEAPDSEDEGGGEGEQEIGEDKRSKFIPRPRFDEVNNRAIRAEQEAAHLRGQLTQMAPILQQMMQQQASPSRRDSEPEIDPDIAARMKPYIDRERELDRRELAELRSVVTELAAITEGHRGWSYIASEVPDWRELAPKVIEYIEALPKNAQKAFREDPEAMVFAANEVRKSIKRSQESVESGVKDTLKNRAFSEGGSSGVNKGGKPSVDYANMSSQDFNKLLNKLERSKARGYIPPDDSW